MLLNGKDVKRRNVHVYNEEAYKHLPVVNISMSCNHCTDAPCIESCPAKAYSYDGATGAVLLDEARCIGCKYCNWNCRFEAPVFNKNNGTIVKCDLCVDILSEGSEPACVNACPTGALKYNELKRSDESWPLWIPRDESLYELTGNYNPLPPEIIPTTRFSTDKTTETEKASFLSELSLIVFSFTITAAISMVLASLIKGVYPVGMAILPAIAFSVTASLFHLGKIFRSWKSLANIRSSPLSREIAILLLFSAFSLITVVFRTPVFLIMAAISGILLVISIDLVYLKPSANRMALHPGQTFVNMLLLASFLAGSPIHFIFIATIKLFLGLRWFFIHREAENSEALRFAALAITVILLAGTLSWKVPQDRFIMIFLLTGILADRILFYIDFKPANLSWSINHHLNVNKNEKKRR
jgi:Fe-S-cluster-containing dehydrogenase component/DMSO reductase anchor subunit